MDFQRNSDSKMRRESVTKSNRLIKFFSDKTSPTVNLVSWDVIGTRKSTGERGNLPHSDAARPDRSGLTDDAEHGGASEDEVLTTFLTQYYSNTKISHAMSFCPLELDWREALEAFNEVGTNRTR